MKKILILLASVLFIVTLSFNLRACKKLEKYIYE